MKRLIFEGPFLDDWSLNQDVALSGFCSLICGGGGKQRGGGNCRRWNSVYDGDIRTTCHFETVSNIDNRSVSVIAGSLANAKVVSVW